jgi:multiple sugar transport system ATP-binding protein
MSSILLKEVWKSFGPTEVIKGVNLTIKEGEFIVLVGPSGCGKSTLLNLIAGLETASAGDISIGGRLVNDVPPKDRNIAMVFQSYALYPTKTVRKNITFGMDTRSVPADEQERALAEVTELLHVEPLLERKPGQLSGGQRQRVAMGRALVRNPDVFLFDEPLSNLDAKLRMEMRTEIKKLHQRLGKTIVYVTHDQVEAMSLATRIAVMDNGHIRQFAAPEIVYEKPADLFVAQFIGAPSMNVVRGRVRRQHSFAVEVHDAEGPLFFPLPPRLLKPAAAFEDQEVFLGLRPEAISRKGTNRDQSNLYSFRRTIDVVEPTGPDTMLVFSLGGIEAVARVHPEDRQPPGEKYDFEANMEKAKLFDVQTGKAI